MIKRQKRSDTEFVDIAELAMSDFEDESGTIFEGFSYFDYNCINFFFEVILEKSFQRGVHPQSTTKCLPQLFAIITNSL